MLMASFMRRAMVYLGLQDDDEHHYDQYGGYPDYPGEETLRRFADEVMPELR